MVIQKHKLENVINVIMFLYIFSLYLLTYREGLNIVSNAIAFILIASIWLYVIIVKKYITFNSFIIIYLLFFMICTISVLYALNQNISMTKTITIGLLFILMFSLVNYVDSINKVESILNYFIYSGVIACLYILVNSDFSQITRFGSELGNVNSIGMILGLSATFSLYFMLTKRKFINIIFLLIIIPFILLTGSRKALLFIFTNFIFILFYNYIITKKNIKYAISFLVWIVLLSVILYYLIFNVELFYKVLGKRLENMIDLIINQETYENSLNTRINMIKTGIEMIKEKPLFGYGIDNYRVLYKKHTGVSTYSHNNYIELTVGVGLIGLITYYTTHLILLINLITSIKRNAKYKLLSFTFLSILISYSIISTTLIYYDSKHFNIILAISSIFCLKEFRYLDLKVSNITPKNIATFTYLRKQEY